MSAALVGREGMTPGRAHQSQIWRKDHPGRLLTACRAGGGGIPRVNGAELLESSARGAMILVDWHGWWTR